MDPVHYTSVYRVSCQGPVLPKRGSLSDLLLRPTTTEKNSRQSLELLDKLILGALGGVEVNIYIYLWILEHSEWAPYRAQWTQNKCISGHWENTSQEGVACLTYIIAGKISWQSVTLLDKYTLGLLSWVLLLAKHLYYFLVLDISEWSIFPLALFNVK